MWNDSHAVNSAPPPEFFDQAEPVDEEMEIESVIPNHTDAWTLLDPHDPTQSTHKPFRKGKIQIPRIPEPTETNVLQFLDKIRREESTKPSLPKNPVKSIAWDEFDTVFIAAQRKRLERRRVEKEVVEPGGAWSLLPPVQDVWNIRPEEVEDVEEHGGMVAQNDVDFGAFLPDTWVCIKTRRLIS